MSEDTLTLIVKPNAQSPVVVSHVNGHSQIVLDAGKPKSFPTALAYYVMSKAGDRVMIQPENVPAAPAPVPAPKRTAKAKAATPEPVSEQAPAVETPAQTNEALPVETPTEDAAPLVVDGAE